MVDPRIAPPVYDIDDRNAAGTNPDAARREPETEIVLDHEQLRAMATERAEARHEPRPPIAYSVQPGVLDDPFVDTHAPGIASARDYLADIVKGTRLAHERYDAQAEAHKAATGAWWDASLKALAKGKDQPAKPEPPTINGHVMYHARQKAQAALTAACLAEGSQIIDSAIDLQDAYIDELMTKRLPTGLTEWSEQPLAELAELVPLVDHLRGLLNRERRRGTEPLDPRRSRCVTLAHILDGGGVL